MTMLTNQSGQLACVGRRRPGERQALPIDAAQTALTENPASLNQPEYQDYQTNDQ